MSNTTQKVNKSRQIVIANQINESRFKMSRAEQKLILYCIAMIDNKEGRLGLTFEFNIQDFANFLEITRKDFHKEMERMTADFAGRVFEIKLPDGKLRQIPALSMVEYGGGKVTLKVNPELAPYLLDLKSRFTKYSLQEALSFKSGFSMRIYQLLSQYQYKQEVEYTMEQLRFCLNIDDGKFGRFFDFKRKVLDYAQKEIAEKSSLKFEYELIKKNRKGKVLGIKFIITQAIKPDASLLKSIGNQPTIFENIQEEFESKQEATAEPNPLQTKLEELGFGENQIKKFLKEKGRDKVMDAVDYVLMRMEKGATIKDLTAYFNTILTMHREGDLDTSAVEDWRAKKTQLEQEKTDWENKQKQEEEEQQRQAQISKLKQEKIAKYKQENPMEVEDICVEFLGQLQTKKKTFILDQVKGEARKRGISLIESVKSHLLTKFEIDNRIWERVEEEEG